MRWRTKLVNIKGVGGEGDAIRRTFSGNRKGDAVFHLKSLALTVVGLGGESKRWKMMEKMKEQAAGSASFDCNIDNQPSGMNST